MHYFAQDPKKEGVGKQVFLKDLPVTNAASTGGDNKGYRRLMSLVPEE